MRARILGPDEATELSQQAAAPLGQGRQIRAAVAPQAGCHVYGKLVITL